MYGFSINAFDKNWTMTFSEIYSSLDVFISDYNALGLVAIPFSSEATLKLIYTVLMGEYGSSSISNMSVDQFKIRLFTLIMSYGPTLERELTIRADLLAMTPEQLQVSAKAIYNQSNNPSVRPTTDTMEELPTINAQNVTKHVRSKLDAYDYLLSLIRGDPVSEFVRRFRKLFIIVASSGVPLLYETNEEDATYG